MSARDELKKMVQIQRELIEYERTHKCSIKVQQRLHEAEDILARAHFAHVGDEQDAAMAKAREVVAAYDAGGAMKLAYQGYKKNPLIGTNNPLMHRRS